MEVLVVRQLHQQGEAVMLLKAKLAAATEKERDTGYYSLIVASLFNLLPLSTYVIKSRRVLVNSLNAM